MKIVPLTSDAILVRSEDLVTAEVDGELLAMSVDQGVCYGLNGVGTRIWGLLAEPRSIDGIVVELLRQFEVEPELCRTQVTALIEQFRAEGLVTVRAA